MWRAGDAAFIDVMPQAPRPEKLACRCRLAGQAAVRHPRQPVAARHRLRRTRSRHARLFSARARQSIGRPPAPARVLLPEGVLDVVERGQARAGAGLYQCRLVSGRLRRLGRGRPAGREAGARAAAITTDRPCAALAAHANFRAPADRSDAAGRHMRNDYRGPDREQFVAIPIELRSNPHSVC